MSMSTEASGADTATLAAGLRRWLASGELQSPAGAFCAWRDADSGELAFEYPEITGYALTWLAGRSQRTAAETAAGRRAADWLTGRLATGDASARVGWDGGAVYTFDLGMIAAGLISFGRLVEEPAYVDGGTRVAARLAELVRSPEGLTSIDPSGPATSRPPEWSTEGRPHLIKCVQALLLAGEDDAADALAGSAAGYERDGARFITQPDDDRVMLHPHLYTVEGLWMWGSARDDAEALDRARRATEWAWRYQLPSGGMPRYAALVDGLEEAPEQWDVTAQAVRAAVMTGARVDGLDQAVSRLAKLARPTKAGAALVYQPESGREHHNAWVSMFGAQALQSVSLGPDVMLWSQLV